MAFPPGMLGKHHPSPIQVSWGPRAAFLGIIAFIAVNAASTGVLLFIVWIAKVPSDTLWAVLFSTFVLQFSMIGVAFALGPFRRGPAAQLLGHVHLPSWKLFGWGAIALGGSLLASVVYVAIASTISDRLVPSPLPSGVDFSQMPWPSFVSIVIIAPFSEETFFRGFLFAGFAKRLGFLISALISASVFGAAHLELARAIPAFLSGIVFAAVYWRSGSVWPCVLAHTAQNAIALSMVFS